MDMIEYLCWFDATVPHKALMVAAESAEDASRKYRAHYPDADFKLVVYCRANKSGPLSHHL